MNSDQSKLAIRAVHFDMDGTLVFHPTQNLHYQSWVEVLKKYQLGFDMHTFNQHFFGKANEQISHFISNTLKLDPQTLSKEKERYYREVMVPEHLEFVPGCEAFLTQLKALNICTGIITSAPYKNLETTWQHLNLARFFKPELVITEEDVIESKTYKPHAAPFLELVKRAGISKDHTVFIGDSNADIAGARNAEIFSVGIATNHSVQELLDLGANLAFRHYEEIDLKALNYAFVESKSLKAPSKVGN
jgi:HAD superfamily hydrolase (TIGR01509 family)